MIKRLKLCLSAALLLMTSLVANAAEVDYTSKVSTDKAAWNTGGGSVNMGGISMPEHFENPPKITSGDIMYQTVTGLPNGTYKVVLYAKACSTVKRDANCLSLTEAPTSYTYVYANSVQVPLVAIENEALTTPDEVTLEGVEVEDGTLKLGMAKYRNGTNWHTIQIKSLTLIGDESVAYDVAMAKAEAVIADEQYTNVTGSEKGALLAAVAAEVDGTLAGYVAAAKALNVATVTFTNAKAAYDKLAHENVRAALLGATPVTIDAEMTAAQAAIAVQELMVAEYNAVDAAYTVPIKLGDWTEDGVVNFDNEHWSGDKVPYKNQKDDGGQGWNAKSWSMSCSQVITLPEGEYVLRVAARRSDGAVVTLNVADGDNVLGTVDDFPVGNTGFGITTSGVASFDAADTYANNNNGFGWQWRYVPFTLAAETAVSISVEASASYLHRWASFGDYTVMAKPSVAAARKAYEVALADAEAVDRSAKMGAAELAALNAAIEATPVETIEWYEEATTALHDATNAAIASIPAYAALGDALNKFTKRTAFETATTDFTMAAEYIAGYEAAIYATDEATANAQTLKDGYREYLRTLVAEYNTATAYVANPSFTESVEQQGTVEGWSYTTSPNNHGTITQNNEDTGNETINVFENYKGGGLTGNMYQEVKNLPNGKYFVKMVAFTRLNTSEDYIYIKTATGEKKSSLLTAEVAHIAVTDPIEVTDGTVEIGLHIGSGSDWAALGAVQLYAYEVDSHARTSATGKLGTICLPYNATVDGAKLYTAAINGSYVTLTEHTGNVEAGVAYIYEATAAAQTFTWAKDADLIANPGDGDLKGVFSATKLTAGSYVMQTQNEVQKFFKVAAGEEPTLAAYRAYLPAPASEVSAFNIAVGEATGINAVTGETLENAVIYNLNGQKLNRLQKGINIINGVKVIVK